MRIVVFIRWGQFVDEETARKRNSSVSFPRVFHEDLTQRFFFCSYDYLIRLNVTLYCVFLDYLINYSVIYIIFI